LELERKKGRKEGRPGTDGNEESDESACGAEPGGLLRNPMPSMPYAGGGSFGSAAPKEPNVPLLLYFAASRSQARA
jgi:hypothetical protein